MATIYSTLKMEKIVPKLQRTMKNIEILHACTLLGYHDFESPLALFFFFTNTACPSPIIFFSKTGDLSQFLCKKFLKYISLFLIFCTSTTHCCHDSYNSTPQHFLEWFVLFIISTQQQHCFIFRKKNRRPTHKPPS